MPLERGHRSKANDADRRDRVDDRVSASPDEEAIRHRAHERFHERGGEHGRDLEDWLEAERELSGGIRRR